MAFSTDLVYIIIWYPVCPIRIIVLLKTPGSSTLPWCWFYSGPKWLLPAIFFWALQKCCQLASLLTRFLLLEKKSLNNMVKFIVSRYPVQILGALMWVLLSPSRKEMASSVILILLNSFSFLSKIEMWNRSLLVNGSKTGVIVNSRQGNLTSLCDWRPFTKSFDKNH